MDQENFKKATASYNPDIYNYDDENENLAGWSSNVDNHNNKEEHKYYSHHSKPPSYGKSKVAQKGGYPAPFHSALNPLDYYNEEAERHGNNQFQKLADKNKYEKEDEEFKYKSNKYSHDLIDSEDEINPDDKLSNESYEDNHIDRQNSNRDKPRSIDNFISNNNSREFRSFTGTDYSKPKDANNMTLELSPDAKANEIMNDISREIQEHEEEAKLRHSNASKNDVAHNTFSNKNKYLDSDMDHSREIKISEDMKRNLNNVMEENLEDDIEYYEDQKTQKDVRKGSFGHQESSDSNRFDTRSTPKMGEKHERPESKTKHSASKNQNKNPYQDQSSKTEDLDNEIGLNLSKIDFKNKNFAELATSDKYSREVLIDKIKKNQNMFDEYSESMRNHLIDDSSNSKIHVIGSSKDSKYEDPQAFSMNSKQIEPSVMHSRELANQFILNKRESSRRNDKVNSSCIISRSESDLRLKSGEKTSNRDISNFQTAFDILVETLSAFEADVARNFKVVAEKFTATNKEINKLKFEQDSTNDYMTSFDNKIESIENRLTYSSDRDDDIWKMIEGFSQKLQGQIKTISDLESKCHEIEIAKMADETSKAEIMNNSFNTKEIESIIGPVLERMQDLESKIEDQDEIIKYLKSQNQRSNVTESNIETKFKKLEHNLKQDFDNILEKIEESKQNLKMEIIDEVPNFEYLQGMEQHMEDNFTNKIESLEKDIEAGLMSRELRDDLSQIKQISFSIGKINEAFKDDVFKLENQIKENSVKFLDLDNVITGLKSDYEQKYSKITYDTKSQNDKIQYLEELFNELYEVIKKHNMQNKKNELQQINHSMMYNARDNRQDLSAS